VSEQGRNEPYDKLVEELEEVYEARGTRQFLTALGRLRSWAEDGNVDVATFLGEILALPGPAYDPCEAYKWYYIGLCQSGYSVEFDDQNLTPPYYCGPVGDFRNESMVSDLVTKLGFEKVRELDRSASAYLAARR